MRPSFTVAALLLFSVPAFAGPRTLVLLHATQPAAGAAAEAADRLRAAAGAAAEARDAATAAAVSRALPARRRLSRDLADERSRPRAPRRRRRRVAAARPLRRARARRRRRDVTDE